MTPNGLINEKSPYLIQHAHNPVNWQPWGDAAFERARAENMPIFLSIGYATCHWCHVMEKESFEDAETAAHLNDTFVCIKVDREERRDIDAVYMAACQMMTGGGGWPLTVFMTPDKKPFFAGTYLPRHSRFGRPGLVEMCDHVKNLWETQNDAIQSSAAAIAGHLGRAFDYRPAGEPDAALLDQAFEKIRGAFDRVHAGFEAAPKFPSPHRLIFLLRIHHRTGDPDALEMVRRTLTAMRLGGIWDHVGLGFHRYATDAKWLLPHFEKMLYDQALLAEAYMEAFQLTGEPLFAQTAHEIFEYVLRDMTGPEGAFHSAQDADSEGEEGKFYVWTLEGFRRALAGLDTGTWEKILRLEAGGNFLDESTRQRTGTNILHLSAPLATLADPLRLSPEALADLWQGVRQRLFAEREKRIHPLKDDKILTDWNGLMIAALATGARVFERKDYAEAARRAATFILERMRSTDGQLFHRFRDGEVRVRAGADDFAFLIHGLLALYQATFDLTFAEKARDLQLEMISAFWDEKNGGFYSTPGESGELPVRPKELYDGAIPSANSVSLENLLLLHRLTGEAAWEERAQELVRAFSGTLSAQPVAFTRFLCGLDRALHRDQDIVIAGRPQAADTQALLSQLNRHYAPNRVTLMKSNENADRLARFAGFTDGLQVVRGKTMAHICRDGGCTRAGDVENISELL
jgi:uncharacterized protein